MLIARYEAKGGKRYLELYRDYEDLRGGGPSYSYRGDGCGGNLGYIESDTTAIQKFEERQVACLKSDFPSVKRVK